MSTLTGRELEFLVRLQTRWQTLYLDEIARLLKQDDSDARQIAGAPLGDALRPGAGGRWCGDLNKHAVVRPRLLDGRDVKMAAKLAKGFGGPT